MNQPVTFCLAFLLFSAASGCRPSVREPQIPEAVVAQTETLRTCLEQGGVGFDHIEGQDAIRRRFIDMPDDDIRKKAALSLGDMLLSVDLKALPYRQREGATRIYREYLYLAFDVMGKCGIEPSVALDYYFNGLSRYRDSCLGVSDRDFLPGESAEDSRWRRDCARKLKDDYRLALSIFERFWLPRLSRVLPPDLHDEFRSRLEDFSSLPSPQGERTGAHNDSER